MPRLCGRLWRGRAGSAVWNIGCRGVAGVALVALVVVLDGGSGRFAAADRIGQALPQPPRRLLIRCPRGTPPPHPTPELLQGFDTASQITALAHWLRHQPRPAVPGCGLPPIPITPPAP